MLSIARATRTVAAAASATDSGHPPSRSREKAASFDSAGPLCRVVGPGLRHPLGALSRSHGFRRRSTALRKSKARAKLCTAVAAAEVTVWSTVSQGYPDRGGWEIGWTGRKVRSDWEEDFPRIGVPRASRAAAPTLLGTRPDRRSCPDDCWCDAASSRPAVRFRRFAVRRRWRAGFPSGSGGLAGPANILRDTAKAERAPPEGRPLDRRRPPSPAVSLPSH